MDWERRFREMIVAGGALAVAGCSNGGTRASDDGGIQDIGGCCNAVSDPCCAVDYCGAPMTPECACEKQGGEIYDPKTASCAPATTLGEGADDAGCCNGEAGTDGGALDATLGLDAGVSDAPVDADIDAGG
jgi:hypothetical protein